MKQKFFTILITVFTVIVFAGCGDRIVVDIEWYVPDIPDNISSGVVINGVRWATRNVDSPGTFTDAPESFGSHFQWNRGEWQDYWGNFVTEWTRENDPCPQGWRVPTSNELHSLINSMPRWVNVNGVYGMLFGTAPNYLFLPFAGFRNTHGTITDVGNSGNYWSNRFDLVNGAMGLTIFRGHGWGWQPNNPANGFSVRCVSVTVW